LMANVALAHSSHIDRVKLPKRECPNVGPPNSDVGIYNIITRRIICGRARAILRRWYHDTSAKDSGPAGWRCAVVRRGHIEYRSYCHRNGRQISFSQYTARPSLATTSSKRCGSFRQTGLLTPIRVRVAKGPVGCEDAMRIMKKLFNRGSSSTPENWTCEGPQTGFARCHKANPRRVIVASF
jgi:hypothetical protein